MTEATAGPVCPGEDPRCLCLLADVFDLLGRKHAIPLLCVVDAHGTVRFGDVEDHLPTASTSTLSARLEAFVEAGYLEREQFDEIPPRVEYRLTPAGEELAARLEPLLEWVQSQAGAERQG